MVRCAWSLGLLVGLAVPAAGQDPGGSAGRPATIRLVGVCRDFREAGAAGGHPDFEIQVPGGPGHFVGIVEDRLGRDGKPVFRSSGSRVLTQWTDWRGRNVIPPREYIAPRPGDVTGLMASESGGAAVSAESVGLWFRDRPGINMSMPYPITLVREGAAWVYDDRQDPRLPPGGGFFIANGKLLGNAAGDRVNQHFTYELEAAFTYDRGQSLTFSGGDDVWVFVDGRLVIDLGGIHGRGWQMVELDRLEWLEPGREYRLKLFYAERHRPNAAFRLETNIGSLRSVDPPPTSALSD